ncbi:hypothetical protein [Chamaesiphon polymorphus]|uniref:Uncharacterized protein n=1 Tax=Chamaesiphon polymorphus CCALA 037 TaxID=2107692 RepID=A0A2T1G050_9CYAN|nr:hypothetical protein [Chamaesiphon polymorphus]PSB50629.1 hypothetical protein C7B77_22550 [Chamaesiphon polymorphus CCALA 037]
MVDKFEELIIPRSTVESIGQQEIGHLMVGFTWRSNVWQQPHKLIQIGLMQIIGAGIIFAALMLPIDRGLNLYRSPQTQQERLNRLLVVDSAITLVALFGINWWILRRGKRLQKLLKLVEQIDRYNQIVTSIATLEKVANLTDRQAKPVPTSAIIEILSQTQQNLLAALKIDRYLREYPDSSQLTISIAHNLINLQNLSQQPQLAEYETLLTQAWEIGMSIYEETNLD